MLTMALPKRVHLLLGRALQGLSQYCLRCVAVSLSTNITDPMHKLTMTQLEPSTLKTTLTTTYSPQDALT